MRGMKAERRAHAAVGILGETSPDELLFLLFSTTLDEQYEAGRLIVQTSRLAGQASRNCRIVMLQERCGISASSLGYFTMFPSPVYGAVTW